MANSGFINFNKVIKPIFMAPCKNQCIPIKNRMYRTTPSILLSCCRQKYISTLKVKQLFAFNGL